MSVENKGWDWEKVPSDTWTSVSDEFLPTALRWVNSYQRILDIGAGKGRHSLFFARNGLEVHALDLSESSISMIQHSAQKEKLNITPIVGDMTNLPYPDDYFDGIVCFHTIYHTDYKRMKIALDEMKRVLKSKGEVYITFNSKDNPRYKKEETVDGYTMVNKDGFESGIPHCYVDTADIKELMSGFTIISMNKLQQFYRREKQSPGIHYFVHARV